MALERRPNNVIDRITFSTVKLVFEIGYRDLVVKRARNVCKNPLRKLEAEVGFIQGKLTELLHNVGILAM